MSENTSYGIYAERQLSDKELDAASKIVLMMGDIMGGDEAEVVIKEATKAAREARDNFVYNMNGLIERLERTKNAKASDAERPAGAGSEQ